MGCMQGSDKELSTIHIFSNIFSNKLEQKFCLSCPEQLSRLTWNWSCMALIAFLSSLLLFRFAEFTLCCRLFCLRRWPITCKGWMHSFSMGGNVTCALCNDIRMITEDREEGDRDGVSGVLVLEVRDDAENLGGRGAREKPLGYAGAELERV